MVYFGLFRSFGKSTKEGVLNKLAIGSTKKRTFFVILWMLTHEYDGDCCIYKKSRNILILVNFFLRGKFLILSVIWEHFDWFFKTDRIFFSVTIYAPTLKKVYFYFFSLLISSWTWVGFTQNTKTVQKMSLIIKSNVEQNNDADTISCFDTSSYKTTKSGLRKRFWWQ